MLDAAAALVLKRGTVALTLDAVAEAAHVSKGGLLYYFDSKNSLLEALADYLAEQLQIAALNPDVSGANTANSMQQALGNQLTAF